MSDASREYLAKHGVPDAIVGFATHKMHVGLRFHKKNVAKMAEKKTA